VLSIKLVLVDGAVAVVVVVLEVRVDAVGVGLVAVDLHLVWPGEAAAQRDRPPSAPAWPALDLRQRRGSVHKQGAHSLVAVDVDRLPVPRVALRQAEVLVLVDLAVLVRVVEVHPRLGLCLRENTGAPASA
jgi:hypothetical protein